MGFFSFLKYTFIIFAVHLATSCGAPFENHWYRWTNGLSELNERSAGLRTLANMNNVTQASNMKYTFDTLMSEKVLICLPSVCLLRIYISMVYLMMLSVAQAT
jgi:hypothetical protein